MQALLKKDIQTVITANVLAKNKTTMEGQIEKIKEILSKQSKQRNQDGTNFIKRHWNSRAVAFSFFLFLRDEVKVWVQHF